MENLPYDLVRYLCRFLPYFGDQLTLLALNRNFRRVGVQAGVITKLVGNSLLTNEILEQPKYRNLRYLDLRRNYQVTSVNHLENLEVLDNSEGCKLPQSGIMGCRRLKVLKVCWNPLITSVNHLTELEELEASWKSGIS